MNITDNDLNKLISFTDNDLNGLIDEGYNISILSIKTDMFRIEIYKGEELFYFREGININSCLMNKEKPRIYLDSLLEQGAVLSLYKNDKGKFISIGFYNCVFDSNYLVELEEIKVSDILSGIKEIDNPDRFSFSDFAYKKKSKSSMLPRDEYKILKK